MSIYKTAAQNKLRFPSVRGDLTVEQLFSLPLKSDSGFDLDNVARQVNGLLKEVTEESFVEETKSDPRKESLSLSLEILKDVIKTRQEESALQRKRLERATERKKILDAINNKQDEALSKASLDELEKKLAELD